MLTNEYLVITEHRRLNQKLSQIEPIRTHQVNHSLPKHCLWFINEVRRLFSKLNTGFGKGIGFQKKLLPNLQLPLGITTLESRKAYVLPPNQYIKVVTGNLLITKDGIDMILQSGSSLPISSSNHPVLALVLGKTETAVELTETMPDNLKK